MSNFPTLSQLGLILGILGLVAAIPNEETPIDIPLGGTLDTAVKEPLNTIKDNVKDLGVPVNASGENSDSLEDSNASEEGKCKPPGGLCLRTQECCSGRCHFFGRRCGDSPSDSLFGPHLL